MVLVLRNYAERMASGYAQVASTNPFASQSNFEHHMMGILQKNKARDYGLWVTELYEVLGKENVCVLLMEEIGQQQFWQQLKSFCELEYFQPDTMLSNTKNSKRKGQDTWRILPFDPAKKAKTMARNIFGFAWPHRLAPQQRGRALEGAISKLTGYYAHKYQQVNHSREQEVQLHTALRSTIQMHYQQSTARLSDLLGKDMAALGY